MYPHSLFFIKNLANYRTHTHTGYKYVHSRYFIFLAVNLL